jgi:hypothetical protein
MAISRPSFSKAFGNSVEMGGWHTNNEALTVKNMGF